QAPARLAAEPVCVNTTVAVEPTTTLTRKKSALVALLRCARYHENDRFSVRVAGNAMAGDWMLVVPPSTSLAPALAPARRAVTRSKVPLTVVPSWRATLELVVASGSPRSHAPVVAVSVPLALVVQPVAVSNVSENTVVP